MMLLPKVVLQYFPSGFSIFHYENIFIKFWLFYFQ